MLLRFVESLLHIFQTLLQRVNDLRYLFLVSLPKFFLTALQNFLRRSLHLLAYELELVVHLLLVHLLQRLNLFVGIVLCLCKLLVVRVLQLCNLLVMRVLKLGNLLVVRILEVSQLSVERFFEFCLFLSVVFGFSFERCFIVVGISLLYVAFGSQCLYYFCLALASQQISNHCHNYSSNT